MKKTLLITLLGLSATAFAADKSTFWEDSKHLMSRERHCNRLAKQLDGDLTDFEEGLWVAGFSEWVNQHIAILMRDINTALRDGCVSQSRATQLKADINHWKAFLDELMTQHRHRKLDRKGFYHEVRKKIDAVNK